MENRVLVVDDKELNRKSAMMLEQQGYKVDVASDVLSAVKMLGSGEYFKDPQQPRHFALLTDLMMPLGGEQCELVNMMRDYDREKEHATGFGLMLYAVKIGVPNIAVLTDMNHHSNSYSAMFDLLYAKDDRRKRPVFRMNDSKAMLFDERDLSSLYAKSDGTFSGYPSNMKDEQRAKEYLLDARQNLQTAKNWGSALETLLGAK